MVTPTSSSAPSNTCIADPVHSIRGGAVLKEQLVVGSDEALLMRCSERSVSVPPFTKKSRSIGVPASRSATSDVSPTISRVRVTSTIRVKKIVTGTDIIVTAMSAAAFLNCAKVVMSVVVGTGEEVGLGVGTTVGVADGALVGDEVVVVRRRRATVGGAPTLSRESSSLTR